MKKLTSPLECDTLHKKCIFLIQRFISNREKLNWGLEIKMAKKLLELFDWEFLLWAGPPYPVKSLMHLLTPEGKDLLAMNKYVWESQKKKQELSFANQEKVEQDKTVGEKPFRSLAEFLK